MRLLWILAAAVLHAETPEYGYQVVHVYPHDRMAFTQGLEFRGGFLYEGTGLEGRSTLRKVKLETGEVVQRIDIAPQFFGEGITVINQQILQLTWKAQMGFVYDQPGFRRLRTFNYPGEGWGLTNDGSRIFMSDGRRRAERDRLRFARRPALRHGKAVAQAVRDQTGAEKS
jgi:glutamine cyclotransferase